MTASQAPRLLLIAAVAALLVCGSVLLGPHWMTWNDLFGPEPSPAFWRLRVPRTGMAACAGAGLAISGAILQALFRNPLATPYTLGIASGASLGAAACMLLGGYGFLAGVPTLGLSAFAGAIAAMAFVYIMALRLGRDMTRLLLAGICFAYMCAAAVMLIAYLADQAVTNRIVIWMMGDLAVVRPRAVAEMSIVLVPVLLYALSQHRALDLLSMGEHIAAGRGVNVARTVWGSYGAVGLLTAVIVANCGPIGFVGLLVPHAARALVGVHTGAVLLASALLGAAFLAVCDGVARSAVYEIPVGVITNLIGAAFFFYLLARRGTG